ncbi:D-alanyl-D-alanine carboxypeptidase [Rhodobacteraceae bacterium 2CG4]|uniref:serine-type D-Ala-D-Ala carboxypeptidase n=1 Tax=Halovulum marinum TaxID=2662447 RepID=A0A6L5YZV1_9RHOB|nr:D-alanyl-D-alanine carboxypeptidase family protein [Halovulum marinum]MSU89846.1 D-alanyl-D-alanine carboxypeptidase [Halovulum marinum]
MISKPRDTLLSLAAAAALLLAPLSAAAFETAARSALVVDHATGTVLLEKDADVPLPPASMSKLMTLFMVFEALEAGRLSLDERLPVSQQAQQMGGSTMFLDTTDKVRVEDLILGVIVQSGNDACVVLAERLAGTETAFAQQMNVRARELGMLDSTFANSTGWPHPDHRMSARDLVRLSTLLIERFPQYYEYFSVREYDFDGRAPSNRYNRNPLLNLDLGADGLKTGHTEEAGYGLVGSAVQNGRRVTMVVTGLGSSQERVAESERLLTWAFREFTSRELFRAGETIATADVWIGAAGQVPLVAADAVTAVVPWAEKDNITTWVEYSGPIEAPIEKGQPVAELVVTVPGVGETRHALQAAEGVGRGGFMSKLQATAQVLMGRAMTAALGAGG